MACIIKLSSDSNVTNSQKCAKALYCQSFKQTKEVSQGYSKNVPMAEGA